MTVPYPSPPPKRLTLDRWWYRRGYRSNPFVWPNAADVNEQDFLDLFQAWYVDPNTTPQQGDLGPAPTLENAISAGTSRLVLIYAPSGGGKTFYRRLAARQIEESREEARTIQITNIVAGIEDPSRVTARDLALCIHDRVCDRFPSKQPRPAKAHVAQILQRCDDAIAAHAAIFAAPARVYVFIDDVNQLFDKDPASVGQNTHALQALVQFCKTAADRSGGEPLALRLFVPEQFKERLQEHLGQQRRTRIAECTIAWRAEHCQNVVEKRLETFWRDGQNSRMLHIKHLLAQDALDEFRDRLQGEKNVSPRCVIWVLDQLARYAYQQQDITTERVTVEMWQAFVDAADLQETLCPQRVAYPLDGERRSRQTALLKPVRRGVKEILFSLSNRVRAAIKGLNSITDWVSAFLLLAALLGSALFVCWCLIHSLRTGKPVSLEQCLQQIWRLIRGLF